MYKKSSKWSLLTKWLCKGPSAEIGCHKAAMLRRSERAVGTFDPQPERNMWRLGLK